MRPETTYKLCLLLLVLLVPLALAQKNAEAVKYDVSKEIKLKGSVGQVKEVPGAKGETSIELMVKTSSETVEVQLCPENVLKEFEVTFAVGDQVEITAARMKVDDQDVVLARQVVRGESTLVLRDPKGAPVWSFVKGQSTLFGR